jgi:hypothetical protein
MWTARSPRLSKCKSGASDAFSKRRPGPRANICRAVSSAPSEQGEVAVDFERVTPPSAPTTTDGIGVRLISRRTQATSILASVRAPFGWPGRYVTWPRTYEVMKGAWRYDCSMSSVWPIICRRRHSSLAPNVHARPSRPAPGPRIAWEFLGGNPDVSFVLEPCRSSIE